MLRKILLLAFLIGAVMNLAACRPYIEWKEEVKLNDGRVIVVEQKKLMEGKVARESWLTINLPEFSSEPMVWHEYLNPLVLNVSDGKLYVVGTPSTGREMRKYGIPRPFYVCFVWNKDKFERIPFEQIPANIYTTNMLIDHYPPKGTGFLTLTDKNSEVLNNSRFHPAVFKHIDPTAGSLY